MKEFKHTPGPWEVNYGWGPTEEHPEWASVIIGDNWRLMSGHVGLANACLIAAAPELLGALQGLVKELSDSDDEGLIENAEPMIAARVAIAKALGETK